LDHDDGAHALIVRLARENPAAIVADTERQDPVVVRGDQLDDVRVRVLCDPTARLVACPSP
jgi:hypothetical protein